MKTQRPKSMTVSSILNFVFGGLGILFALIGIVTSTTMMSNPLNAMANKMSPDVAQVVGMFGLIGGFLSLAVGAAAIVSGIGLLQTSRWGRGWTLGYAIAAIANCLIAFLLTIVVTLAMNESSGTKQALGLMIGLAAAMGIAKCVYPVVLLFLLRTPKWKEAFATNSTGIA